MAIETTSRRLKENVVVAELRGRLVYGDQLQLLKTQFASLVSESGMTLVLDLSMVEYVDSSGIGTLLYLDGVAEKAKATLRIAGVTARVREVLQMTHTDKILQLDPDVANSLSQSGLSADNAR
jgi:anti-sigma B factor antagonist